MYYLPVRDPGPLASTQEEHLGVPRPFNLNAQPSASATPAPVRVILSSVSVTWDLKIVVGINAPGRNDVNFVEVRLPDEEERHIKSHIIQYVARMY